MFAQELLSGKGQIASFYLQPRILLSMRRWCQHFYWNFATIRYIHYQVNWIILWLYGILCTYIRKMILTFFQRWILYSFSMYLQWKRIWNRRTKGACKDRWWKVCRYHSRCQNRTKWATQSRRYWSNKASFRRNFVRVNGSTSRWPNSSFNNKIKCWWSRGVLRIKAS